MKAAVQSLSIQTTVWPVIRRELQAGARQGSNYWLRVGAGAGAVFTFWMISNPRVLDANPAQAGQFAFRVLSGLLLASAVAVMPAITADCISREKREGTLGLLFLTPLTPAGVVIGKVFVQVLRGVSIGMACLPVLAIPFLLGGVTASDAVIASVLLINVGLLGLAGGMIGSALTQNRTWAFLWSGVVTVVFLALWLLAMMFSAFPVPLTAPTIVFSSQANEFETFLSRLITGDLINLVSQTTLRAQIIYLAENTILSLCLLWLGIRVSAGLIQRSWQDKVASAKQVKLHGRFCTPLFKAAFRRKSNRQLDRNPIAWLQEYSWKARLSKWGLCLAFLIVICTTTWDSSYRELTKTQLMLALVFALLYTFAGVNGFLKEKQNGVLELLLVTPLKVSEIILGRAVGLWKQFFPAALLFLALQGAILSISYSTRNSTHFYDYSFERELQAAFRFAVFVVSAFLSLPFLSTYFALRVRNLIVAAVLTWIGLCLSGIFGIVMAGLLSGDLRDTAVLTTCVFASYLGLVMLVFSLLHRSFSRRLYSF